jgi:hypothetical protein
MGTYITWGFLERPRQIHISTVQVYFPQQLKNNRPDTCRKRNLFLNRGKALPQSMIKKFYKKEHVNVLIKIQGLLSQHDIAQSFGARNDPKIISNITCNGILLLWKTLSFFLDESSTIQPLDNEPMISISKRNYRVFNINH